MRPRLVLPMLSVPCMMVGLLSSLAMAHAAQALTAQGTSVGYSATGAPTTLSAYAGELVPLPQRAQAETILSVFVSERIDETNPDAAIRRVIQRTAAIRAALEKLGVPATAIAIISAGVIGPTPAQTRASEQLRISGLSPDKMDGATEAALAAGATSVSRNAVSTPFPRPLPQPEPSVLDAAVKRAAAQATAMARAAAQELGLTLGTIRSVVVQLPETPYGPGIGPRVNVTVTYNIRQP